MAAAQSDTPTSIPAPTSSAQMPAPTDEPVPDSDTATEDDTANAPAAGDDVATSDTSADDEPASSEADGDDQAEAAEAAATQPPAEALLALGLTGATPPIADPPGGQSGADDRDWTVDPRADITEYGASRVTFTPDLTEQLFGNTSFPCGAEAVYVVTCPPGVTEFPDGDAVVVFMRLAAPVAAGGGSLQYGVAFDDDGDSADNYFGQEPFALDMFNDTEHWYRLLIDADGHRHVYVDGIRDGALGFPRPSAAVVIEWGDTIVWVIPGSELAGELLDYRLTTFFNTLPLDQIPTPDAAGGDVSGLDVSTRERVADDVFEATLGPAVPADVAGTVERTGAPAGDSDLALAVALVQVYEDRLNEAFATGETEPVRMLLHFLAKASSADGCVATVQRSFPNAQRVVFSDVSGPEPTEFLVTYRANATVSYPTGDSTFPALLAPDVDGRLSLLTDCSQG